MELPLLLLARDDILRGEAPDIRRRFMASDRGLRDDVTLERDNHSSAARLCDSSRAVMEAADDFREEMTTGSYLPIEPSPEDELFSGGGCIISGCCGGITEV